MEFFIGTGMSQINWNTKALEEYNLQQEKLFEQNFYSILIACMRDFVQKVNFIFASITITNLTIFVSRKNSQKKINSAWMFWVV